MTKRLCVLFAAVAAIPVVAVAQSTPQTPTRAATSASEPANPIASSHAKMYALLSGVVVAAAEKMPEENYTFKPADDVRTFGQLAAHLADSQYYFCALAAGEKKPESAVEKTKSAKAEIVAALKEAVSYCNKIYGGMTDAKGGESVKLMNMDFARLTVLSGNTAHCYEHYGNMSTYMRIKGVVPPTSEKAPAATSGQQR